MTNAVYVDGGPSVTGDNLNTFPQICNTFSDMRAFIGVDGMAVVVKGGAAVGDGNGGWFYWNSAATAADDDLSVIVPNGSGPGAWLRQPFLIWPPALPSLAWFGTIAELRAATIPTTISFVMVTGYYVAGDKAASIYGYQATSTAADDGGAIIKPTSIDPGSAGRWQLLPQQQNLYVDVYGALGTGLDERSQIQAAFEYAYSNALRLCFLGKTYRVGEHPDGGYCIRNRGASFVGETRNLTVLGPLSTVSSSATLLQIVADAGAYLEFMEVGDIILTPLDQNAAARCGKAMHIVFGGQDGLTQNFNKLDMHGVYCLPGGLDISMKIENNPTINIQGNPSNSIIHHCAFWEGIELSEAGDSVVLDETIIRSTIGSGRTGVKVYEADTSGNAALFHMNDCNIDADGGAFFMASGRLPKLTNNNIEQSHGAGTVNGAVVDFDGSSQPMPFPELHGNHIGIFGTATVTKAVRIGRCIGADIDDNTIRSGRGDGSPTGAGIYIENNAQYTNVGMNEIAVSATTFTAQVVEVDGATPGVPGAVATMGIFRSPVLENSWENMDDVITAASWASTSGGQVTYTTTTPHGLGVGVGFVIGGMTPTGYNGAFVTIAGTAGSTLVAVM